MIFLTSRRELNGVKEQERRSGDVPESEANISGIQGRKEANTYEKPVARENQRMGDDDIIRLPGYDSTGRERHRATISYTRP